MKKLHEYISKNYRQCMTCKRLKDARTQKWIKRHGKLERMLMKKILLDGVEISHGICEKCREDFLKEVERIERNEK